MSAEQRSVVHGPDWERRSDSERGEGERPWPSKNNRQAGNEGGEPAESVQVNSTTLGIAGLLDMSKRPAATRRGEALREECVIERYDGEVIARSSEQMLKEWRSWMDDYRGAHLEFVNGAGETVRAKMTNSYHKEHANKYYAKLKGLEREISETWGEGLTTAMLTCSASNLTADGLPRAVVDHMVDVREGWGTARKQLHNILDGYEWEYARVWEPHKSGYGHMHIALFIHDPDDEIGAGDFEPFMRSYVSNCDPAGWEAHRPDGDAVSVNHEVNNVGSYISEYIGQFGEEELTERPLHQQMFYAATWASNTRRVDFSNGAQELISRDLFRQQRGLDPDRHEAAFRVWRGGTYAGSSGSSGGSSSEGSESDSERIDVDPEAETVEVTGAGESGTGWVLDAVCRGGSGGPEYYPPPAGGGGVSMIEITAGPDDVPADRGGPPAPVQ